MPVLHRGVAHVAELRLPPGRLAVKSAVGIGRACMRVVRALLPMEVGPAVIIAVLRQYFPRGTDLSRFSQAYLNGIALRLNQRPRKTLAFETPANRLQLVLH